MTSWLDTPRVRALALLLILASGCGRVVKLQPPEQMQDDPAFELPEVLPPSGRCLPDQSASIELFSAGEDQACDHAAAESWAAWSDEEPPGLCYALSDRCPGLEDHVAYLTFDDGPIDWTPAILDTLAAQGVQATFFVNAHGAKGKRGLEGSFVDEAGETVYYRDLLKRELDEGHVIGNHTVDHLDLGTLSSDEIVYQFQENERLVNAALVRAGGEPRPLTLLRPPFGSPWGVGHVEFDDPKAKRRLAGHVAARFGYNVLWNVSATDAFEWAAGEAATYEELAKGVNDSSPLTYKDKVERVRSSVVDDPLVQAGAGIVVLMHDTHNSTRDALPAIIEGLRAHGYRFETLEDEVLEQYARSSAELTPGPALSSMCTPQERDRSCAHPGGADDGGLEVCGRFWLAFEQLGGVSALGRPLTAATQRGTAAQRFERGTIELHPEWRPPCDVVFIPNQGE